MKIHKVNPLGEVIETIELNDCFKIKTPTRFLIELKETTYYMTPTYIDEMKFNMQKIQNNFIDNMQ